MKVKFPPPRRHEPARGVTWATPRLGSAHAEVHPRGAGVDPAAVVTGAEAQTVVAGDGRCVAVGPQRRARPAGGRGVLAVVPGEGGDPGLGHVVPPLTRVAVLDRDVGPAHSRVV